ncbi:MAG TPA: hypothetical protein VIJ85_02400 [Rhizomicrobium sp.]
MRLVKILTVGTALLTLTLTSAYADGSNNSDGGASNVLNGQVNLNTQQATLNMSSNGVVGVVSGAAMAGGNAIDIATMNNTNIYNNQYVGGVNIGADAYANIANTAGEVQLQSQSVCNSAGIAMDSASTSVSNTQNCSATDTSATLHANVSNTLNDATLATTAVGNTIEEETNAPSGSISNSQTNHSSMFAGTTVRASNIDGNLSASATAIGNTGQITHYSTGN